MAIKVLTLNFPSKYIPSQDFPSNIEITESSFEVSPTPHDFHVVLIDASEVLKTQWWKKDSYGSITSDKHNYAYFKEKFKERIDEQILSGGLTFCFSSREKTIKYQNVTGWPLDNYFFCPVELGVVNEKGDTFNLNYEELRHYKPLFNKISLEDVEWDCYFSKPPEGTRIIGTNRAKYPVFIEVPLGGGRLIMLPRFKGMLQAVSIIINEIIPQLIHADDFVVAPKWVHGFSSPYEQEVEQRLKELETAKRLIYTKDKTLEKAVAFAFKKLGFKVEILPDGTLPDLRILDGEQKAVVEIKGHETRQSGRKDILQLLGYISEEDTTEKGVFVTNHEFNKEPNKRKEKAFTEGAIQLADRNDLSLVSTVDLYGSLQKVLENRLNQETIVKLRKKIMNNRGLTSL